MQNPFRLSQTGTRLSSLLCSPAPSPLPAQAGVPDQVPAPSCRRAQHRVPPAQSCLSAQAGRAGLPCLSAIAGLPAAYQFIRGQKTLRRRVLRQCKRLIRSSAAAQTCHGWHSTGRGTWHRNQSTERFGQPMALIKGTQAASVSGGIGSPSTTTRGHPGCDGALQSGAGPRHRPCCLPQGHPGPRGVAVGHTGICDAHAQKTPVDQAPRPWM